MGCAKSTDSQNRPPQTDTVKDTTPAESSQKPSESKILTIPDSVDWKTVLKDGITEELLLKHTADYLHSCLTANNDVFLIDIICTTREDSFKDVCTEYSSRYPSSLPDAISEKLCPEVSAILCQMLQKEGSADNRDVADAVSKMVDSIADDNLFENEMVFQQTLQSRQRQDVRNILEGFLQRCQRDICVEIEKQYSDGPVRRGYTTLAQVIRDPMHYLVEKIHTMLPSDDVQEQRHLAFIILSQDEATLDKLRETYRSAHFDALSSDVAELVKDNALKNPLLKTDLRSFGLM